VTLKKTSAEEKLGVSCYGV